MVADRRRRSGRAAKGAASDEGRRLRCGRADRSSPTAMDWGTPTFRQRTKAALREANRLGLKLDITLGPGWPISAPVTEDLSTGDLQSGPPLRRRRAERPDDLHGPGPRQPAAGRRAQAADRGDGDAGPRRTAAPQVLDPGIGRRPDRPGAERRDAEAGRLPPGRWKLFGFWMRPSLMRGKTGRRLARLARGRPFQPAGDQPGARRFRPPALRGRHGAATAPQRRRRVRGLLRGRAREIGGRASPPCSGPRAMPRDFAARRHYDLTPAAAGPVQASSPSPTALDGRLKHDFDRTLNDLLIAKHLKPIIALGEQEGAELALAGLPGRSGGVGTTENSRLAAAAAATGRRDARVRRPHYRAEDPSRSAPRTARAVLDRYRQVVSGAHLSGAKVITNEWGAVFQGQFGVRQEDLKALADRSLAAGRDADGASRLRLPALRSASPGIGPGPTWPGWCAFCGGARSSSRTPGTSAGRSSRRCAG